MRITPCLENRKTCLVNFLDPAQVGIGSTEFIVMRPRAKVPPSVPYAIAVSETFRNYAIQRMVGTSGRQRVGAAVLESYELMIPTAALLQQLAADTGPMLALIAAVRDESRTLAKLRDTLLPALMSGRLRVKDAERQVEDAVS